MDVSGKKPTSKTGEYFRNNVWWWRPLADYCLTVAPDICKSCKHWQSNDGDGLNGKQSKALAAVLEAEIASGRTLIHEQQRKAEIDAMPDESCRWCAGTGVRTDSVGVDLGYAARGWCNGCDGKGTLRPNDAHYPFSVENVSDFVAFLKDCGGFSIY